MQSFTRRMNRGNLIPVWNQTFKRFDFYKRLRNSGTYSITRNPYGNGSDANGPGISFDSVIKLQKLGMTFLRGTEKKEVKGIIESTKQFFKDMFSPKPKDRKVLTVSV